ncbi:uncharacterized protein LMH87_007779 [Akanthomyces muscarius]|uniref:Uncharacterized protein n=1 Tax=Akanthomyces muscarius TaxID=2231603 RepID=A0A9W8UQZ4_AKAMU|nr:uncharacterized protein LMH87_007779 [Akanthomyces muscarius]KAJ4159840.1 hypothetical protein LMH87_007779 [Akanthomyces muscarius]
MGFLAFLQRRQSDKTSLSSSPSTITLQRSSTYTLPAASKFRSRSDADLVSRNSTYRQQLAHETQAEASGPTPPPTAASSGESPRPWQSETIPSSNSAKRLSSASSSYSDLLLPRTSTGPGTHTFSAAGRHVDLLDAHGQIGPSDFRARLQASGSRDYGEDVAERNIGQNGLLLGSPAVQNFYATRSAQVVPRRQNTSASKYRKYANKEIILEDPEAEDAYRPSSRASSLHTARSLPITRVRVTSIFDSPVYTEARRASVASIGLPKLEEASSSRKEVGAEESDDAFPPSIPRFRRSEAESSGERPSSALGSVRRARQSVDVMSAYHMGEPIKEAPVERMFGEDGVNKWPASRNQRSSPTSHQQNLSIENMLRWRQSFGDVDEDQRSVATERATDSRASQRHCWSVASTEPTERSDVSSVNLRPVSRATATTSVDLRSLMDLDESCCKARASYDIDRAQQDDDVESCSITTDGSDVDAFVEKRKRRGTPEDEALLFNESGFFTSGGGALPGLFGGAAETQRQPTKPALVSDGKRDSNQTLKGHHTDAATQQSLDMLIPQDARPVSRLGSPVCPELHDAAALEEEDRCSSIATPESVSGGAFVPQMYLTQRQRLLALGFDYDTDDDDDAELAALDDSAGLEGKDKATQQRRQLSSSPLPRLSIIVEAPPASEEGDAAVAARRRKEAKKLTRSGGPRARLRRVGTSLEDEGDGNLADVE